MEPKYISIAEVNSIIKDTIDCNYVLNNVYLKGEISNFKNHTRGHLYFSLKDDTSKISAVMFYNNALKLNFNPVDGDQVLVNGRISCYEAAGTYQIYVNKMEKDGLGNLYIEYEKLKKELNALGYFSPEKKKLIPKYPTRIGVVTASTGAAIRDIMSTIKRRYPVCEVLLFPALVQGNEAAKDIARQIKRAEDYNLDTLIIGRGGGSIEDLWAFNERVVADAIYESTIPIISAVGHEVDYTIADYVADLRAPTPTGAAELAVPQICEVINTINNYQIRANEAMNNMLKNKELILKRLSESYVLKNPMALYEIKEQKLDNFIDRLNNSIKNSLDFNSNKLVILTDKLNTNMKTTLDYNENKLTFLIKALKILNPLNILESGYSLTTNNKEIVKSVSNVSIGDELEIKVTDGLIITSVKEIKDER